VYYLEGQGYAGEPGPREQVKREIVRKTEPIAPHGTNQHTGGGSNRTSKRGENAEYLTARLKRDAPDIAAQLERGEFKSVRQAAIEVAGGAARNAIPAIPALSLLIPRIACARACAYRRVIKGESAGIAGIPFSLLKGVAPGGFVRAQS
jgi:hypothetical protein